MWQNLLTLWHGNKFFFFIYRKTSLPRVFAKWSQLIRNYWAKMELLQWVTWKDHWNFLRRFKMLFLMLKINCMHTYMCGGERETQGSSVPKQNTACVALPGISDTYYRYWYYQNRAWENSFQISGKREKTLKTFSPYSENKAVIISWSLRITTKENCFPMANVIREKRERLSSFLTVSLPSSNTWWDSLWRWNLPHIFCIKGDLEDILLP